MHQLHRNPVAGGAVKHQKMSPESIVRFQVSATLHKLQKKNKKKRKKERKKKIKKSAKKKKTAHGRSGGIGERRIGTETGREMKCNDSGGNSGGNSGRPGI